MVVFCELAYNLFGFCLVVLPGKMYDVSETIKQHIADFFAQYPTYTYKKGEILLRPDDEVEEIINIESGYAKSYSINEEGYNLVINIYKPYSFLPITETLAERTNPYFFEAMTDIVVQKAPTKDVHEFIKQDKEVLYDLTRRISSGLEGFMIRTQYLIRSNATQKVTSALVLLARRFGEEIGENQMRILLPQTHADIADMSGCTRETASIELKKLQDDGVISIEKKLITVLDFEELRQLSAIYYEDEPLPYSF